MTAKTLPPHGTLSRHRIHGCRCQPCIDRVLAYRQEIRRRTAEGTWAPFVDAEPVRRHIRMLIAAGFTPNRIAVEAGVSGSTTAGFLRHHGRVPRRRNTTPEIAAKILAVTPDTNTPAYVDATGTRRRLQALAAMGWTITPLAPRCGLSTGQIRRVLMQQQVRGSTAVAVTAMYEELRNKRPEKHGIPKGRSARFRREAAAKRWPTPKYWDRFPGAIDDPHFTPEYKVTKAELLAEEASFLVTVAGLTRTQAAERLGKDKTYVDRVLSQQLAA